MGLFSSKKICAMCGKEEPEPQKGCFAADNRFRRYIDYGNNTQEMWKFIEQQGIDASDIVCPFCYNRLIKMYQVTRR